jgi:hypothetical protein
MRSQVPDTQDRRAAESNQMSRHEGERTSKDDGSRAHPGRGCFLRGSTWAFGDFTSSKQVREDVHLFDEISELFGGVISARCCGGAAPGRSQGRHETSGGAHRGLVGQLTPRAKFIFKES